MTEESRRRFLKGLGLGLGAPLLLPVADLLTRRAYGRSQTPSKRFVLVSAYQLEEANYTPSDIVRESDRDTIAPVVPASWPEMFDPYGGHMSRSVFVDGLRNYIGSSQHRAGTCALSCVRPQEGNPEGLGPAGGPTIDQVVARGLDDGVPFRSLNWGLSGSGHSAGALSASGVFATGPDGNLPHYTHAGEMLTQVFGEVGGGSLDLSNRFRPMRDRLIDDVNRLRSRLAYEEQVALDVYEEAVLAFDERQQALSEITCDGPEGPALENEQDHLVSMMAQSTLALQCGLTRVIGATIGTSMSHNSHEPHYRELDERTSEPEGVANFYSHGKNDVENHPFRLETKRHYHQIHLRELATMLDSLALVPEADGSTALDHTVVVYASGNGMANYTHHAGHLWPLMITAGKNVPLNCGGRYMGCSMHPSKGERWALTDVFSALAVALDVDSTGFGDAERATEPFAPLLL